MYVAHQMNLFSQYIDLLELSKESNPVERISTRVLFSLSAIPEILSILFEKRDFKFKMGNVLASALTGFVVGAIIALIIYLVGYFVYLV